MDEAEKGPVKCFAGCGQGRGGDGEKRGCISLQDPALKSQSVGIQTPHQVSPFDPGSVIIIKTQPPTQLAPFLLLSHIYAPGYNGGSSSTEALI